MFQSAKRAETKLIAAFGAVICFFFVLFCLVDYRDSRHDALTGVRSQSHGIVSWVERNLEITQQTVRAVAEEARSDCREGRISTLVGQLLRTVSVDGIEVRDGVRTVCTWKPPVEGPTAAKSCPASKSEGAVIPVKAQLSNGMTAIAYVDVMCLLTPFVLSLGDARLEALIAAGLKDVGAVTDGTIAFPAQQWWNPQAHVVQASEAWPLAIGVSVPEHVLARIWAKRVPLHVALFMALGGAFWLGPVSMMRRRFSIDGQVRSALKRGEFRLLYLPTVEVETGTWVGVEALLRWHHGQLGLLQPSAFIPWIEKSPLIHDTTSWVMTRAAADLAQLRALDDTLYVGINVPPSQLGDSRLADAAISAFGGAPNALARVMFELTEREVVDYGLPVVQEVVKRLRAHGALFALDDFGVGFSNLNCLDNIRVDVIKVDKSFTQQFDRHGYEPHVIDVIVRLAQELGMTVIAEGVETEGQREHLRRLGIRLAQGFLFCRPLELEKVLAHLDRRSPVGAG
ncbi:EAL domain-containing protein [Aquabacter spiritensis]|uniref:EAL domain-containing protein (Putative c-di-GMP-specific phosphodiesterase class I) n=1 Tax=Aquabacter spiritensis TaxID=933073 RepID=A0A4R3LS45_9HYPH|nr:EAL domain-containing protein [Aquabacter spiritensis]TCT00997.1 EAL domain-containing protein (putative c-di-GMP-specific phosphodiesterase class I) [Aquabacter spiritensis]